jgi:hypothetical protein
MSRRHKIGMISYDAWRFIARPILIHWVTMPVPACICEPRAWLDESSSYDCDDFLAAPGLSLMSVIPRRADTL